MLARIVENWLTSAGELGYQLPFMQLLAAEGSRVLHAPVHHPYEHGKDIVAYSPSGELHAFQLKGGDISLSELERIQGQLFALAGTTVSYPGVEPPRRPNRAYLVTNGRLSTPARDRLRSFNDANRANGFPPVESIELDQLVGRFTAVHGEYFPVEPREINRFLELYLTDGYGPVEKRELGQFLRQAILEGERRSAVSVERAIASATLLTAYLSTPWQRLDNHLGVAEVWLILCATILLAAEEHNLDSGSWQQSYELAFEAARGALVRLLDEACEREDLVIPHLVEGFVYPSRAALVCGYCSALFLSESTSGQESIYAQRLQSLLLREYQYFQIVGESGVSLIVTIATALELVSEQIKGAALIRNLSRALAAQNQPRSDGALADPYHSIEESLLSEVGSATSIDEETFDGAAYSLHVLLEWLARRDYRSLAEPLWPDISRIHMSEFRPDSPKDLLEPYNSTGVQLTWSLPNPTSWSMIQTQASTVNESELPQTLWQRLEFLPFLPLLYPYRLTGAVGKALDYLANGLCTVKLIAPVESSEAALA